MKHLTVGPGAGVWCRASVTWEDTTVFAARATCLPCVNEYIVKAWSPSRAAVCRPVNDHCETLVPRWGALCPGHANAAAQYAAE